MTALPILITNAGLAAIAALSGTAQVTIAQVGLTEAAFVMAPTITSVPAELMRISAVGGLAIDDRTVHLTARDVGTGAYALRGLGLYLADGTLFGVYAQATPIFNKVTAANFLLAVDIRFSTALAASITFGNAEFVYPPATETIVGVAEIATQAETDTGNDDARIVTPKKLAARLLAILTSLASKAASAISVTGTGLATGGGDLTVNRTINVAAANDAEAIAGTLTTKALTPASGSALIANRVAALVDSSPGALDTLNELAAALGADPNFAATVAGQIAARALATRSVAAAGLATGGGDLTADRTISVPAASDAEAIAGASTAKALTPAAGAALVADRLATTRSIAAGSGHCRLPGTPIVMQWCQGAVSANGAVTIAFPVAFDTACVWAGSVAGVSGATDAKDNNPIVTSFDVNGASIFNARDEGYTAYVIAFGF